MLGEGGGGAHHSSHSLHSTTPNNSYVRCKPQIPSGNHVLFVTRVKHTHPYAIIYDLKVPYALMHQSHSTHASTRNSCTHPPLASTTQHSACQGRHGARDSATQRKSVNRVQHSRQRAVPPNTDKVQRSMTAQHSIAGWSLETHSRAQHGKGQ